MQLYNVILSRHFVIPCGLIWGKGRHSCGRILVWEIDRHSNSSRLTVVEILQISRFGNLGKVCKAFLLKIQLLFISPKGLRFALECSEKGIYSMALEKDLEGKQFLLHT